MKKISALLLILMLLFGLAACGHNQQAQNTEPAASDPTGAASEVQTSEGPTVAPSDTQMQAAGDIGGKTLVVYYSATGSTENVAKVIADAAGADLLKLEPVEPYSSDDLNWNNADSRVNREHENESEQVVELVASTVDNWADYDTVFIGYPIWWGNAAWPVNEFMESNDFTGKTVIPFCTSLSSDLGESGERLEEMAGTGDWQKGQRFRSSASEDDVRAWVEGLG